MAVAAYSTQDISLAALMSQFPAPLPFCSVRIQFSGPPGSVAAQVSSVESKGNLVVDSHVQNEGNGWAGSGANPWHLDQDTEAILFLTNESDQPARIGFNEVARYCAVASPPRKRGSILLGVDSRLRGNDVLMRSEPQMGNGLGMG